MHGDFVISWPARSAQLGAVAFIRAVFIERFVAVVKAVRRLEHAVLVGAALWTVDDVVIAALQAFREILPEGRSNADEVALISGAKDTTGAGAGMGQEGAAPPLKVV